MSRRRLFAALLVAVVVVLGSTSAVGAQQQPDGAQPEIIGGTIAEHGSNPYVVALLQRHIADPNQGQFCGGSLISPDTVLTAAHCVQGQSANTIDVLAGTVDLSSGGQRVHVRRIRTHPRFDPRNGRYDAAVLQLGTSLPFDLVVPYEGASPHPAGTVATVSGWGATSNHLTYPTRMRTGTNLVRSSGACTLFGGALFDQVSMLCAGGPSQTPAACYGDSGGPLVVNQSGTPVQIGIVSFLFTSRCGTGQPIAYGRVAAFTSFVHPYLDPDSVPGLPTDVRATRVPGGVTLTWKPPVFDGGTVITGYRLTTSPATAERLLSGRARSVTVTGLTPGTTYAFSLQAVNGVGPGSPATITARAG